MKYLKLMITAELLMMGGSAFATAEDSLRCDTLQNVIVVANRKYNYDNIFRISGLLMD